MAKTGWAGLATLAAKLRMKRVRRCWTEAPGSTAAPPRLRPVLSGNDEPDAARSRGNQVAQEGRRAGAVRTGNGLDPEDLAPALSIDGDLRIADKNKLCENSMFLGRTVNESRNL